jgi:hypothetical protein
MKSFFYSLLLVVGSTAPAFGIAITSPSNGGQVSSPFTLTASSATCSYQPVTTIGYSLDSGGTTKCSVGWFCISSDDSRLSAWCITCRSASLIDIGGITVIPPTNLMRVK